MIKVSNISVNFGGLKAVDDVSLEIPSGRITGLIGPNGAGKTTLFNVIAGHIAPTAGDVFLDGVAITKLKPHQRAARGLARTFQIPQEFTRLTVLENLMAAASQPVGENVFNVIFRRTSFRAEEEAIYHTALETMAFLEIELVSSEKAGNLSGGQKKLLELGRALMRKPTVILLDEVGAGINRSLLSKIAEKIKLLNQERGLTFALIEHDLDFVSKLCDRVFVMAQGSLLAEGTVAEVRADERVIDAYFGGGKYEGRA
jgi:branched-chain amino acid transport system ATP-binding protein